MSKMTKTAGTLLALSVFFSASSDAAPYDTETRTIPITEGVWTLEGRGASIVEEDGRQSLKLNGGTATIGDIGFEDGVISYEIKMEEVRGFSGVYFRLNDQNGEYFYIRSHQSGNPDANQYTPVFNGMSGWHLYYGDRYSAPTQYTYSDWMPVTLVVSGDKMDVYIGGGDEPDLHVDDLLGFGGPGALRFGGARQDFYISNIRVLKRSGLPMVGEAKPLKEHPKNLVTTFDVSTAPILDGSVEARPELASEISAAVQWQSATVDESGAVNLAKYVKPTDTHNTALARLKLTSDKPQTIRLKYGFSDRVTVFLNGIAIAHGDDTYVSRDYRFLGTLGLYDSVFLPLQRGENVVTFAVTEGFGGWGVKAAFPDTLAGVRVE